MRSGPKAHVPWTFQYLLQRQSVPFVCQIFNDKTVAALSTLKDKLRISEGAIVFVKLITDWFHMMNVKYRFSGINTRDECRQPANVGTPQLQVCFAWCVRG